MKTPKQVAELFHVAHMTVIDWITSGLMPATDTSTAKSPRRKWLISDDDLIEFKRRRHEQQKPTTPAKRRKKRDIPKLV